MLREPRPGTTHTTRRKAREEKHLVALLGPAFVAAIAYVDPGNVAANISAGATYGYLLVWVLVAASAMAVVVQYLSAKLGIVTGRSLPQLLGDRLSRPSRLAYWAQAEIIAAATDLAEVVGGAIALHILFGVPMLVGGVIIAAVSMVLLAVRSRHGARRFEQVVVVLLVLITAGFVAGLFVSPFSWADAAAGLVPRFEGSRSVLLAASMLGATVMPHAIYAHSDLARERFAEPGGAHPNGSGTAGHGSAGPGSGGPDAADFDAASPGTASPDAAAEATARDRRIRRLLRATRWDVLLALAVAGSVNVAMLLLAAASLGPGNAFGTDATGAETETIAGAHAAISAVLGPVIGAAFGIGLLISSLASTSVGSYAGAGIMQGLLRIRVPLLVRRAVTLLPALAVLALGIDATWALVLSQVVLSIGIPFALIPLVRLTGSRRVMGGFADRMPLKLIAGTVTAAIVALNVLLLVLIVLGDG